jgi:hypothetical protein
MQQLEQATNSATKRVDNVKNSDPSLIQVILFSRGRAVMRIAATGDTLSS